MSHGVLILVDEFTELQSVPCQASGRRLRRRARRAVATVLSDARQAAGRLDGLRSSTGNERNNKVCR